MDDGVYAYSLLYRNPVLLLQLSVWLSVCLSHPAAWWKSLLSALRKTATGIFLGFPNIWKSLPRSWMLIAKWVRIRKNFERCHPNQAC